MSSALNDSHQYISIYHTIHICTSHGQKTESKKQLQISKIINQDHSVHFSKQKSSVNRSRISDICLSKENHIISCHTNIFLFSSNNNPLATLLAAFDCTDPSLPGMMVASDRSERLLMYVFSTQIVQLNYACNKASTATSCLQACN